MGVFAQRRNVLVGIALMVAAMQAVPFTDALAKLLTQTLPVMMVVFMRTFAQSIFLVAAKVVATGKLPTKNSITGRRHVLRGFLWWLATALFFFTIKSHDIPAALAIFFAGPIFIAATAPMILGERFDPRFLAAAMAGFVGVLVVLNPDFSSFKLGLLPALLSGFCYGGYIMATRHVAQDRKLGAGEIAFGAGFWASALCLPFVIYFWSWPTAQGWIAIMAMGALSALGHLLIALACQRTDATKLSPYTYTEMIGAVVASMLLFGTLPEPGVWLGIFIIVATGIWGAIVSKQKAVDAIV